MKPPSSLAPNSDGSAAVPVECGASTDGRCGDADKPVNGCVKPAVKVKAEASEVLQNGAEVGCSAAGNDGVSHGYDEDLDEQLETAYKAGLTVDTKDDNTAPEDWESEIIDACDVDLRLGQNNDPVFVPCHMHPLSSRRKQNWTEVSEGQFDDVDT